jgi:alpha-amylase
LLSILPPQDAWPYGIPRIMSSFAFEERTQGPPHDGNFNLRSPTFDANGQCNNGWVCEHRWPQTANMIAFRNNVEGTTVSNW